MGPLAAKMAQGLPGVTRDDLVSVGYEALTIAATRYDPDSGVPFLGFAYYRMRGAMIDAARKANPQARQHARALRVYEATQSILEEASAREGAEAAHDQRSLRQRVEAAARLVEQTAAAVLLAKTDPVEPDTVGRKADTEATVDRRRLQARVQAALEGCSEQDRALVQALYHRGLSATDYARELGKNKSTISRAHRRLLGQLATALAEPGPPPDPPDS